VVVVVVDVVEVVEVVVVVVEVLVVLVVEVLVVVVVGAVATYDPFGKGLVAVALVRVVPTSALTPLKFQLERSKVDPSAPVPSFR
jgi:hypothetical protein